MSNAKVKNLWKELKAAFESDDLQAVNDKSEAILELIEEGYEQPGEFDINQPGAKREGFRAALRWLYIFTATEIRKQEGIQPTLGECQILSGHSIGTVKARLERARNEG